MTMTWAMPVSAEDMRASINRPLTVVGRLEAGACAQALTLAAQTGERYELGPKRITVRPGERARFDGRVYPRISLCGRYPWVDVTSMTVLASTPATAASAAETVPNNPSGLDPSPSDLGGAIAILVAPLDRIEQGLREAQALRTRLPPSVQVAVGVPANQRVLLPRLLALSQREPRVLAEVAVAVLPEDTTHRALLRFGENEQGFASVEALLEALKRDARPTD